MAKGEVCCCIAVAVYLEETGKAESKIPEETTSILELSASLQNPWKTEQEN